MRRDASSVSLSSAISLIRAVIAFAPISGVEACALLPSASILMQPPKSLVENLTGRFSLSAAALISETDTPPRTAYADCGTAFTTVPPESSISARAEKG